MRFYTDMVCQLIVIEPGTPKKKKGLYKSGNKTAIGQELANTRAGYYYWLGSGSKSMYEWLERRRNDKVRWFDEFYVRQIPLNILRLYAVLFLCH